jgi:hypothetical protein
MGRSWCLVLAVVTACAGDDDSGSGDPAFGHAHATVDGTEHAIRYAWAYPMRGAQLENTERNLGWTITFTETPTPLCATHQLPPAAYIRLWTDQVLMDAVEGVATLPTDFDFNIMPGIVSFPSGRYGEAWLGMLDVSGEVRLTAFSTDARMTGSLTGYAYDGTQRMPVLHPLSITFDTVGCP